jgi:hypothetical protein
MAAAQDKLRGEVFGRTAQCVGFATRQNFSEPEIDQFGVSISIYEAVLGLQVTVGDIL